MSKYYVKMQSTGSPEFFDGSVEMNRSFVTLFQRWDSLFCNALSKTLTSPARIWWMPRPSIITANPVTPVDFTLDDKYIVNFDKELFVDCNKYRKYSSLNLAGDCLHPLPILTVTKPHETIEMFNCADVAGEWAGDWIQIVDTEPKMGELVIDFAFRKGG